MSLLGGHALHALPLLVPVVASAAVLGPSVVRRGARALWQRPAAAPTPGLVLASAGTAAAALVHLVVMPEHLRESLLYGAFFLCMALVQGVFAWSLLLTPPALLLRVGALGNGAAVTLWAVTRSVGLPFGPFAGQVERVGPLDLAAVTAELLALAAALAVLRTPAPTPHPERVARAVAGRRCGRGVTGKGLRVPDTRSRDDRAARGPERPHQARW